MNQTMQNEITTLLKKLNITDVKYVKSIEDLKKGFNIFYDKSSWNLVDKLENNEILVFDSQGDVIATLHN